MAAVQQAYRARMMGLRQTAVFGLPIGLLVSGALIETAGVGWTLAGYGLFGLCATLVIGWLWSRSPTPP